MKEKELAVYVGNRIREERKRKKITQRELGKKIGVKHNTISSYENGINAPEQNAIFKIARALDVKVDDLFPSKVEDSSNNILEKALQLSEGGLELKDIDLLNRLIEKALSMNQEERDKFLESIRFTVEYHEKMNKND